MKTHIKKVLKAVETGDQETAKKELPQAMKKIDKCVKRNVIHQNQASRKISKLSKKVSDLSKGSQDEDASK
jgi:small subunit ribosomal protein S20